MKEIYLPSTGYFLRRNNVLSQKIILNKLYLDRRELTLAQLIELKVDLKNYNIFIICNVKEDSFNTFLYFLKENRKFIKELTKLINNKFKSM